VDDLLNSGPKGEVTCVSVEMLLMVSLLFNELGFFIDKVVLEVLVVVVLVGFN